MVYGGDSHTWKSIFVKANRFLEETQQEVLQGINPGGVYQAIWCRDASYIIRDWFLSGNIDGVMQQIFVIWSHQIGPSREEKLIYGRGSPEMKFSPEAAKEELKKEFQGALPTTIYQAGFSEVYGQYPDIDSTALMVSTTSWILNRILLEKKEQQHSSSENSSQQQVIASEDSSEYVSALLSKLGITDPLQIKDFVVPRMLKAVDHLVNRDIDEDGLLEQSHNEDWMDTMLRAGKIVYSQACWVLALIDFSALLSQLEADNEATAMMNLAKRSIRGVEDKLWSEENCCYLDLQDTHSIGGHSRALTQDISLYLVAITHERLIRNTIRGSWESRQEPPEIDQRIRSVKTLDTIKNRIWKDKWPLVNEREQKITGPRILKPIEYHSQTFWPWATATEILARSRFNKIEECDILLAKLVSENHPSLRAYHEWINPITDKGEGAFPFRTGISAVRIVMMEILERIRKSMASPNNSLY
jgi:hypothetical protein